MELNVVNGTRETKVGGGALKGPSPLQPSIVVVYQDYGKDPQPGVCGHVWGDCRHHIWAGVCGSTTGAQSPASNSSGMQATASGLGRRRLEWKMRRSRHWDDGGAWPTYGMWRCRVNNRPACQQCWYPTWTECGSMYGLYSQAQVTLL